MDRTDRRRVPAFVFALWLVTGGCGAASGRANIVFILADDLGYGDIGEQAIAHTPNLDALADGGMRFTDFHSAGPVCIPTRAALMTGRYPWRFGMRDLGRQPGLPLEEVTIAEMLGAAGYRTGLVGKWHLGGGARSPLHHGFDTFVGHLTADIDYQSLVGADGYRDWWVQDQPSDENGYATGLITRHAVAFIEENRARPFFLLVAYNAPHTPHQGPYDPAERASKPWTTEAERREILAAVNARIPKPPPGHRDGDPYPEMIETMDAGIGEIVRALKRLGLEERTLVVFHSDNGPSSAGSAAPLRGGKRSVWEGGHRVPTLAYWPGRIEAGAVSEETGISMDWVPTLLAVAGVTPPPDVALDGVDIGPVLFEGGHIPERALFWRLKNRMVVRRGPWKLVAGPGEVSLFDLDRDLAEENDVSAEHPDRTRDLVAELRAWGTEVGIPRRHLLVLPGEKT